MRVPFNRPFMTGRELEYIAQAHAQSHLSGDGPFTVQCQTWLEQQIGCAKALLTHSCTAALELAALLLRVGDGDEVIMPSFTFASTANAFVLRGATPVFVDIRPDTLNIDELRIENSITSRTKAIVPVHYAGVGCEMDTIGEIAIRRGVAVVEDAAQAAMARYRGRPLGSFGVLAALSFHETKNVISGEGGALLVNDPALGERAEIIRHKGTNRGQFFRGLVDKYTWVDIGSSYPPSELVAAFLWAQLEQAILITNRRLAIWQRYHDAFNDLETRGLLRRPIVPHHCAHNAHMYYIILPDQKTRDGLIAALKSDDINAVFHYVPLHSSPAGIKFGRAAGELPVTDRVSACLLRLPMWIGMDEQQGLIIDCVRNSLTCSRLR